MVVVFGVGGGVGGVGGGANGGVDALTGSGGIADG